MKQKTPGELEYPTTIGRKLWYFRKINAFKLKEVSNAVGIKPPYLSQVENGIKQNISLDILRKLSTFYKVSLSELLEGVS